MLLNYIVLRNRITLTVRYIRSFNKNTNYPIETNDNTADYILVSTYSKDILLIARDDYSVAWQS